MDWMETVQAAPSHPGVYIMTDDSGSVIYVGKAKNLKKRLASYLKPADQMDMKTGVLVKKIVRIETIVTKSESEALILESNLIKRHRPRYNVILKDDKRYPSLKIDPGHPYPRLEVVRKIRKDGALYFGPFTSSGAVHQTIKFINKTFKLRKCPDRVFVNRSRPCLNHQIGACLGPCCLEVNRTVYDDMVKEVILFLKGRTTDLLHKIRTEMTEAAELRGFEKAAERRDTLFALQKTTERQIVVTTDFKDRDVIGLARRPGASQMTVLTVREGRLIDSLQFAFQETLAEADEMVEAVIFQYYDGNRFIPKEILIPTELANASAITDWLCEKKGEKVVLLAPRRGEKSRLVRMAVQNAETTLLARLGSKIAHQKLLARLADRLRLSRVPIRIECFDNSNVTGALPVSAMVVFEEGLPHKASYRKFTLRTVDGPDDYAAMEEALMRRYEKKEGNPPLPDLLMVDGGKGQLNMALSVLDTLGLSGAFDVIAIAKKNESSGEVEDKIYLPGRANPALLDRDLLHFLQRVRDEAHRFVISFHRRRREKSTLASILDGIPGVGKERKKALISHFGGVKKIRDATASELAAAPGIGEALAETIRQALNRSE